MAQGNDELVRRVILNDGVYNFVIVQFLVIVVVVHVKQLVNDVGKFLRHLLADLWSGCTWRTPPCSFVPDGRW